MKGPAKYRQSHILKYDKAKSKDELKHENLFSNQMSYRL